jgi:hypothetical protein
MGGGYVHVVARLMRACSSSKECGALVLCLTSVIVSEPKRRRGSTGSSPKLDACQTNERFFVLKIPLSLAHPTPPRVTSAYEPLDG